MCDANRESAQECLDKGKTFLREGRVVEARRLLERSMRLYPSEEAERLLRQVQSTSPPPPPRTHPDVHRNNGHGNHSYLDQYLKMIHPDYRQPILIIFAVVVLLLTYRMAGGDPILASLGWGLGHLPGDLYYQQSTGTSSVQFYFPLTSCLVFSWIANYLRRP